MISIDLVYFQRLKIDEYVGGEIYTHFCKYIYISTSTKLKRLCIRQFFCHMFCKQFRSTFESSNSQKSS